jgi:hypothetical protein
MWAAGSFGGLNPRSVDAKHSELLRLMRPIFFDKTTPRTYLPERRKRSPQRITHCVMPLASSLLTEMTMIATTHPVTRTTCITSEGGAVSDLDLDLDCVQTFEQVTEDLAEVETKLGARLGLRKQFVRRELIALDKQGRLVEDELVAHWHELYASYMDWTRSDTWDDPGPESVDQAKGAAEAALSFFVVECCTVRRREPCLCTPSRRSTSSASTQDCLPPSGP